MQWVVLSAKCFAQMTFECSNTKIVDFYTPTVITPLLGEGSKLLDTITDMVSSKTLPFNIQYYVRF